jgi:dipeptidase D
MGKEITHLNPSIVWKHFYDLTQIPRPSSHEKKVIEHIKKFAEVQKLDYTIDETGNIIIRKPAVKGKENVTGVVLQSHVDMVPQKNSDKNHNFETDPIETIIDGEWLRANKTTLGADNGIGVASMLAVLESTDISHGPVEALFTITEETGMDGAFGLNPGMLKGKILLNLDSEDEGELFVGCAGGINGSVKTTVKQEASAEGTAFEIVVSGLKGGHSGLDINLGRGNSNKILARLLWSAYKNFPAQIASFKGGNLRNAIPRESHAKIIVPGKFENDFKIFFNQYVDAIKKEYSVADPDIKIALNSSDKPAKVLTDDDAKRMIGMINAAPNGVARMSDEMQGMVETSLNLAIVNIAEGTAEILYLLRSSVDSAKYALAEQVASLHQLLGCEVEFSGDYPGWKPNSKSIILKTMVSLYEKEFGKKPEVKAIHAGLECGIIGGKYHGMDMISFGPTIRHPHSPDEKVKIDTVEMFWKFLKGTLGNIQ